MNDPNIVTRLRDLKNAMNECGFTGISAVTNAAADEIERLRKELEVAKRSADNWKREAQGQAELRDLFIRERDEARSVGWGCLKENMDE